MIQVQSPNEMAARAGTLRSGRKTIALVPVMGSIHAGKEALIRAASGKGRVAVVALFANPLQLGPHEPAPRYNNRREQDLRRCEECGVDTVFAPTAEEVYPRGFATFVTEETLSRKLCGVSRPTHFRGVTTYSAYLFNLIRPASAYFGQKTFQRAAVVQRMSDELKFGVESVIVPTVREADGLAAGTDNNTMTPSGRQSALALFRSLEGMKKMVASGVTSPDRLIAEATHVLGEQRRVRVIYVAVIDRTTLEPVREVAHGRCLGAIAAWVDEMRLIDNILL